MTGPLQKTAVRDVSAALSAMRTVMSIWRAAAVRGRAYDFALYKTWQGARGHYYDLVLHYGKADMDYYTTV